MFAFSAQQTLTVFLIKTNPNHKRIRIFIKSVYEKKICLYKSERNYLDWLRWNSCVCI